MTLSKWKLRRIAESMRVCITKEQERVILARFGTEPEPYEWSEQDIMVQLKNYLGCGEFVKSIPPFNGERLALPDGVEF